MKVIASLVLSICTALGLLSITPSASAAVPVTAPSITVVDTTSTAQAARPGLPTVSGWCRDGRCAVYLSRAETRVMGWGALPVPGWVPFPVNVALAASIAVHRYIARSYYNQGRCGVFLLSTRPWESQGFSSYRC